MKAPTQKQIAAEAKKLEALLTKLPRTNFFGEDLHAKVRAEIAVLTEDLAEADIYDRSNDEGEDDESKEWNVSEREAALNARRWIDGDEDISPSASWASVVEYGKKQKKP